jgi:hypothetical protein
MAKRKRDREGGRDTTDWSTERTLADAEADVSSASLPAVDPAEWSDEETIQGIGLVGSLPLVDKADTQLGNTLADAREKALPRCACGGEEFVLEAYLAVIRGRPQPEPLELEALTCPQCGREYEAIWLEDGRVTRGEFRGQGDVSDD